MRLKDVLLGAVASLVVTVIGGITVYYFTKEPDQKKTEHLIYTIQQSASFKGGSQDVAFATVRLKNDGGVAAKRVVLSLAFTSAEIKDFALEGDSSAKHLAKEAKQRQRIELTFKTLLPEEAITLNLLLSSPEKPTVSVRSDSTLGVEQALDYDSSGSKSGVSHYLEKAVPLTGLLVGLLVFLFFKSTGISDTLSSNKNNAGFLLLHHGLVDDANTVLTDALRSGHYDALTLSNLAVCKALQGEHEQAKQLLRASGFRDVGGHIKAVTIFNEALVSLITGNKDEAITKFKQAIDKSAHIRRYCQRSVHLDAIRSDPAVYELIKN